MSDTEHDDDVVRLTEGTGAVGTLGGRLPWPALAALGLACFAAGVMLVRSTLTPNTAVTRREEARVVAPPPPRPATAPRSEASGAKPTRTAPAPPSAPDAQRHAAPPPEPPEPAPPQPAPQAKAEPRGPSGGSRVAPGRVAYLRCEGLERPQLNPPCPRDADYELAVLRELDALASCAALPAPPFTGDLRIEVRGSERTVYARGVSGAAAPPAGTANGDAWVECIREDVTAIVPGLSSPRLVVSFRFDVLPR